MSNFFPNKAPDLVLVDMINAHFQSNAQRSDFTFGTPLLNDNPFINTQMAVTVNSGPLFGRLTEVYYNRLDLQTLLTDRNISLPGGNYSTVADLLPVIEQNYNITIGSNDIVPSSIEDATTESGPTSIRVRMVATGGSIAYYGVGDVTVSVSVTGWTSYINVDNDFAATLFPNWEAGYPMTGFAVSGVETGVPLPRQIQLGLGISYNGNYQLFDVDNQVDLTVATAESWAIDVVLRGVDDLPLDEVLAQFPYIPFVELRLFNPQPGYSGLAPLRFTAEPDNTRSNLRTWMVQGVPVNPSFEFNQSGEYISRTRIVDENNQPPTFFSSVMAYFNDAIGNNGTHFNEAIFVATVGLMDTSDIVQFSNDCYFTLKHFLDQPQFSWSYSANANESFDSHFGGSGNMDMMPNGETVDGDNMYVMSFEDSSTSGSWGRFKVALRVATTPVASLPTPSDGNYIEETLANDSEPWALDLAIQNDSQANYPNPFSNALQVRMTLQLDNLTPVVLVPRAFNEGVSARVDWLNVADFTVVKEAEFISVDQISSNVTSLQTRFTHAEIGALFTGESTTVGGITVGELKISFAIYDGDNLITLIAQPDVFTANILAP